jgi:hypothetical protein
VLNLFCREVIWHVLGGNSATEPIALSLIRLSPEGIMTEHKYIKWKNQSIVGYSAAYNSPWPSEGKN